MSHTRTARCLVVIAALSAATALAQTSTPVRKQTQPQAQPQPQPAAAGTLTAPVDPQPTRPDPDVGEAQQRATWPPGLKIDLALVGSFSLGSAQIPWGNIVTIADTAALTRNNGRCVFAFRYPTGNKGGLASVATQNRIMLGTQAGPLLASSPLPALQPTQKHFSSGKLVLKPGESMIYVHADGAALNAESDEANNLRRVRVTVEGDCR
jgi:hypothetical protein